MGEDRFGTMRDRGGVGQGAGKMPQGTEELGDPGPGMVWRAPLGAEDEDIAKRMRLLSAGRSAFMLVGGAKTILLMDQKWNQGESYLA